MADDLLTVEYGDGVLQEKYKNYLTPAARVTVAGTELSKLTGARLEGVRVSLSMNSAASADITVADIWDEGKKAVREAVKTNLTCGKAVKVELGYDSEYVDVFHGFIYETSLQFSDVISMQVTVMDIKRLMADNMRMSASWNGQTVLDVFNGVMADYKGFGLTASVDEDGEKNVGNLIQRGSDLSLIQKLCRKYNLRFVVYGDQAKLTPKNTAGAIMKLLWGRDLLSFSKGTAYVNAKIVVKGTLKKPPQKSPEKGGASSGGASKGAGSSKGASKGAGAEGENSDESGSLQKTDSVTSPGASNSGMPQTVRVIEMTNIESEAELEDRLGEELEAQKEGMHSGKGSCMGMPVLIPGRYIEIDGIDGSVNGTYYMKAVSHSFGADGFSTDFTLGGKEEG